MIAGLFLNPGFLLIAAALVSVPIIIHLINRMRFKRVRWAAMEFLLKAQKRTRRRLIIEQLLLLALRCLLIALVGLLVSRFIGCGDSNTAGKPNLHLVLLDDTLSMQDVVKGADGAPRVCFEVAKTDWLIKKIAKGLAQSKTGDQLMVVQLSKIDDPEYKPAVFTSLNDTQKMKEFVQQVNEMEPSARHVNMVDGVKLAQKLIGDNAQSRVTLHVLSDFRAIDWSGKAGESLYKEFLDLVRSDKDVKKDVKIRPIDPVLPQRADGFPPSNPNVGIVDIRPSTRIAGHKMPVHFTIDIANYSGKQVDVSLVARNEETGKDMDEVDFDMQGAKEDKTRIRLSAGGLTTVTFDYGDIKHGTFFKDADFKDKPSRFAHLSVRLTNAQKGPLDNDGLALDNIRHTVVEVREKVPILVVDGDGPRGREESKDSFILERSLASITGASYQVEFGDVVGKGNPGKALEQPDLNKYPTIFLCNVRELSAKQVANLENFVKEGGGVAFYMGPLVNPDFYNKSLYKGGQGIFPVPLKGGFFPPANEPELKEKDTDTDTYQLITRDEKFADKAKFPIFGKIFEEARQKDPLRHLPIRRYFKVDRAEWNQEPGKVLELATLPNKDGAEAFNKPVADITRNGQAIAQIRGNVQFAKYLPRLEQRLSDIEDKVRIGTDAKAYHIAAQIDILMNDRGGGGANAPDLTQFWDNSDPNVATLKRQLNDLRERVNFGDPFIVTQTYGKGKVVAVMSTVGKDWNDWCGGCTGSVVFPAFIWEMQNELSSPGAEANLTVGANLPPLTLDADQFRGVRLKLARYFMKTEPLKAAVKEAHGDVQVGEEKSGKIPFRLDKNYQPGLYLSELYDDANPERPLAVYAHAFNVDTQREGQLQRVGSEELKRELETKANELANSKDAVKIVGHGMQEEALVAKQNDFSESPWLFLILLLVLVAEQALAVHLSFHLKNAEDVPTGVKA